MLSSKTVFIVGAGASQEVDMPVGSELRDIIAKKLDMRFEQGFNPVGEGDLKVLDRLRFTYGNELDSYLRACTLIKGGVGLSASIDDFIDIHRDDPEVAVCGKLAIAAAILDKERGSKLWVDPRNIYNTIDFGTIQNTWYVAFLRLLQVPKGKLDDLFENVTIICFNYDRCIEQFLVHAISKQYGIKQEEARSLVRKLQMFRPYGSVGDYFGAIPFGSSDLPPVESVVSSLRTYTEQIENREGVKTMKTAVVEARTLVILGSAFHENNMTLLQPDGHVEDKRIFATRKGILDPDLPSLYYALSRLHGIRPPRENLDHRNFLASTCNDLFDTYKLSLRR